MPNAAVLHIYKYFNACAVKPKILVLTGQAVLASLKKIIKVVYAFCGSS